MSRLIRALLCLAGRHRDGFYLSNGMHADRYRCRYCGRVYAARVRVR